MTERWICPHGFDVGFFPVPDKPHLIEHRSCGICCEEITEKIFRVVTPDGEGRKAEPYPQDEPAEVTIRKESDEWPR